MLPQNAGPFDLVFIDAFFERAGTSEQLKSTVLQTLGRKGHDGFAMSIVTE